MIFKNRMEYMYDVPKPYEINKRRNENEKQIMPRIQLITPEIEESNSSISNSYDSPESFNDESPNMKINNKIESNQGLETKEKTIPGLKTNGMVNKEAKGLHLDLTRFPVRKRRATIKLALTEAANLSNNLAMIITETEKKKNNDSFSSDNSNSEPNKNEELKDNNENFTSNLALSLKINNISGKKVNDNNISRNPQLKIKKRKIFGKTSHNKVNRATCVDLRKYTKNETLSNYLKSHESKSKQNLKQEQNIKYSRNNEMAERLPYLGSNPNPDHSSVMNVRKEMVASIRRITTTKLLPLNSNNELQLRKMMSTKLLYGIYNNRKK